MAKKETISLCLIVKNEEEFILSCINSVKHLVDEIIVVDTGSHDQTASIAGAAGAKVFHFTWRGDFSEARNFALEQADCDWIMVLDADETLAPVGSEEFKQLLSDTNVEGYYLHIKNYVGTGQKVTWDRVVRLFRNKPVYRFTGAIHEQVAPAILNENGGSGLKTAPLVIKHYGYLKSQVVKKDKFNRNKTIINQELQNNPNNPFLLYCLAVEHYQEGKISEGLQSLEKALRGMHGTEGYFEDVVLNIAVGLLKLGRIERLIDFTSKSLEMLPENPNLLLLKGIGNFNTKKYLEAVIDLNGALEKEGNKALPDFKILSLLGDAYNLSANYTEAKNSYLRALKKSSRFLYPLTQLIGLIQRDKFSVSIEKLSRFTSLQKKKEISGELVNTGEISLALIILLLSIYDVISDNKQGENLLQLSASYSETISLLKFSSEKYLSFEYLSVTAQEIYKFAALMEKGYDSCFFPVKKRLKILVENSLLLLIKEFCPSYSPGPFAFTSGTFLM